MGFVLFDKLHFYLLYWLRLLVFRLIISWNFSFLSIYSCSSECDRPVWAAQGPDSFGAHTHAHYLWLQFVGTSITGQRQKLQSQDLRLP